MEQRANKTGGKNVPKYNWQRWKKKKEEKENLIKSLSALCVCVCVWKAEGRRT